MKDGQQLLTTTLKYEELGRDEHFCLLKSWVGMNIFVFCSSYNSPTLFQNLSWVRARLCKLQKRVHLTHSRK